jgi:hypothetical protein
MDFCIQPGRKMAGQSLDDACNAQHVAASKASCGSQSNQASASASASAHVTTASSPTPTDSIDSVKVNGKTYYTSSTTPTLSAASGDFAGMAIAVALSSTTMSKYKHYIYEAFTMIEPPHALVDWSTHSRPTCNKDDKVKPVAFSVLRAPIKNLSNSPFVLDMGATCHISPVRSDFKTLHQIAPHPITGVGGAKVHATGIGSIELCIASGL